MIKILDWSFSWNFLSIEHTLYTKYIPACTRSQKKTSWIVHSATAHTSNSTLYTAYTTQKSLQIQYTHCQANVECLQGSQSTHTAQYTLLIALFTLRSTQDRTNNILRSLHNTDVYSIVLYSFCTPCRLHIFALKSK